MARNKQIDLDNHLFECLERLNDDSLTEEELEREVKRSRAVASLAAQINQSRANSLRAAVFMDQADDARPSLPEGFR